MPTPSIAQLNRAIAIQEQIEKLEAELQSILSGGTGAGNPAPTGKRKYTKKSDSAPAKRKYTKKSAAAPVAAADSTKLVKAKRTMSAEGRARIIAAQKTRWAKAKKGK